MAPKVHLVIDVDGRQVVCDPTDHERVIAWMQAGKPDDGLSQELLAKGKGATTVAVVGEQIATCKYGENAWQAPAHVYSTGSKDPLGVTQFEVVEGTDPSFNNRVDIDRLLQTSTHIAEACDMNGAGGPFIAVGVKHGNPCGAAVGQDPVVVLRKMVMGDPLAIFGGLVLVNFEMDEELGEVLTSTKTMLDGIVAPGFTPAFIEALRRKGDKCRFIRNPALSELGEHLDKRPRLRPVRGGFLVQPNYTFVPKFYEDGVVKYGASTMRKENDMVLAWAIGSTSNSNTITLVKDGMLIGNGVGQQDRVGAAKLAIERATRSGHEVKGAVAYSDSFFPFVDGPQALINAGISAIFTSSGSVRDKDVIELCQKHGVTLYMVPDAMGRGFCAH